MRTGILHVEDFKLKKSVAILTDSVIVSQQIYELITLSQSANNYEITTLIVNEPQIKKKIFSYIKQRGLSKFLSVGLFRFTCWLEITLLRLIGKKIKLNVTHDLSNTDLKIISVRPQVTVTGIIYKYSRDDLRKIKEAGIDLIIRGGSGILRGAILTSTPLGIISFHHGDNRVNRGGPPAFWEVYDSLPQTGFTIQVLTDELDGGKVLYRGLVNTSWMYTLNLEKIYNVANPFMHKIIDDITSTTPQSKIQINSPYCYPLYTAPKIFQTMLYCLKTFKNLTVKIIRRLLRRNYRWGVAYQFTDDWKSATLSRSKVIPNPKNRFIADPFIISRDGSHYCFVEDFDYKTMKGSISLYVITKDNCEALGKVLEEDFHLSFPFVFEYEDELYMCPETHEKNEIRIYKCISFPFEWEFHQTLMNNVTAVDTLIFQLNNRWWLLSNIEQTRSGDHCSQLHAFHSDNPLSQNWISHTENPIIHNSSSARNGGLIIQNGEIYRTFQRQGFDSYGEAIGVSKVVNLTNSSYLEERIFTVEPRFFDKLKGCHTYNYDNGLLVLNFVKISNVQN